MRAQIWTLIQAAQLHHDLHIDDRPGDDAFDDFLLHVDGYLCEIKDAQIRDGLHILGQAPDGEARTNLVLAILRARQVWGGVSGAVPGLREALGLVEGKGAATAEVDRFESRGPRAGRGDGSSATGTRPPPTTISPRRTSARVLRFAATEVVPRLARTTDEIGARAARARRRLRPRRAVRLPHPRPGQRAADRAQLLLRRSQGDPVAAGLGDRHGARDLARRPLPRRHRRAIPRRSG